MASKTSIFLALILAIAFVTVPSRGAMSKRAAPAREIRRGFGAELAADLPQSQAPTCSQNEFRCNSGDCIQQDWKCDQIVDCPDYSDESDCGFTCQPWEFKCATVEKCIPAQWVCDRDNDCGDYSDEMQNCYGSTTPYN